MHRQHLPSKEALDAFTSTNPTIRGIYADVSDPAAVDGLFALIEEEFDGLDVLVNNAGVSGPTGPVETMALDDIRRTIEIDLIGQFVVFQRAAPLLKRSDSASIINISSVAGRLGYPMRSPYSASKWGIVGLTASLAKEMGLSGVRVNAILPGVVRGERMDRVMRPRADASNLSLAEVHEEYVSKTSLRRMVEPDDVALTALFLSSPAGNKVSGQSIGVCGNVETL